MLKRSLSVTSALAVAAFSIAAMAQQPAPSGPPPQPTGPMSFFVTSTGPGDGANLGGLAGADAHCQKLAAAVNAGDRTWRAYLSTTAADGKPAVNARDRIGKGPWFNQKQEQVATNVDTLHGDTERDRNNVRRETTLNERGAMIAGRGESPNQHDILTGSGSDGRVKAGTGDTTCGNWTNNGEGSALVGHSDRQGGGNTSWNSAHPSRGCSQENLRGTGGEGLFYCFAE